MAAKRTRLDRFISSHPGINRREVRGLLASGRVMLNGKPARDINQVINQFDHVSLDGRVLQALSRKYRMLNKPSGVVSATRDDKHKTVIDLLDCSGANDLHIAGRLDFNSTGLLLLTNDGEWTRGLASPEQGVRKVYQVTVEKPLSEEYVQVFAEGLYFAYEGITTRPAGLRILSAHSAQVTLTEGRYHQIKRMFGHFDNKVLTLHRAAIGGLSLDIELAPGQSRNLSPPELASVF